MPPADLFLKKNEDRRLRQGHLWIFSNEIDTGRSPLNQFSPGDVVQVKSADGRDLGTAYINPATLICARLLSRKATAFGPAFFRERLTTALALRQKLFKKPFYRLAFGESDGLPGLVIDRFGDVLSVQIGTAGMERRKAVLVDVLADLFRPEAVIFKNDGGQRRLEGLPQETEIALGRPPDSVILEENGLSYRIDILRGQKTGWFYDHRQSRAYLQTLARGLRVLDLFSYSGAWGIGAAAAGASSAVCVDASEPALELAAANAELNRVGPKTAFVAGDVFDYLKQARQDRELFDLIILDPPALIKRKKDYASGLEAYRRLNHLALQVLARNGILCSASCSYHLSRDDLKEILRSSGRHIDRHLVFFAEGGQGPDHPITPSIPETDYLKTFFCAVSASL